MVKICISLFLLSAGCAKPDQEEFQTTDPVTVEQGQGETEWVGFLEELNFESIILVQKDDVIMDALKEASEGDVLFVEAGIYKEDITVDQPNIALIGVDGIDNNKVVVSSPSERGEGISMADGASSSEVINIQSQLQSERSDNLTLQTPRLEKRRNRFLNIKRSELCSGIAHYQFEVRIGKGPFDIVRLHRVVKEYRPYRPVRTKGEIFMIHGSSQDFDDIFLRPGVEDANTQNSSQRILLLRILMYGV